MGATEIKEWYRHSKMTKSQLRVTNVLVDLLASEIVKRWSVKVSDRQLSNNNWEWNVNEIENEIREIVNEMLFSFSLSTINFNYYLGMHFSKIHYENSHAWLERKPFTVFLYAGMF